MVRQTSEGLEDNWSLIYWLHLRQIKRVKETLDFVCKFLFIQGIFITNGFNIFIINIALDLSSSIIFLLSGFPLRDLIFFLVKGDTCRGYEFWINEKEDMMVDITRSCYSLNIFYDIYRILWSSLTTINERYRSKVAKGLFAKSFWKNWNTVILLWWSKVWWVLKGRILSGSAQAWG